MLAYAPIINKLPLHSVKFHQLQIVRGTAMEREFASCPSDFVTFTLDGYLDFIADLLERLRPDLYIERFAGEVPPRFVNSTPWDLSGPPLPPLKGAAPLSPPPPRPS